MTTPHTAWSKGRPSRGFSLMEVVIALGVVAFTLVSLIGLLAGGLQTAQESVEDVQASHLASAILGQRRSAPTATNPNFVLPPLDSSADCPVLTAGAAPKQHTFYLTRDGAQAASVADRHYRLDAVLSRNPPGNLARAYLSLTTPWQAIPPDLQGTAPSATSAQVKTRFEVISFISLNGP